MTRPAGVEIASAEMTPIVGDGAMSIASVGGGRLITALIIDCRHRPDIVETVRLHGPLGEGDIRTHWGECQTKPFKNWYILRIEFVRPTTVRFAIPFNPMTAQLGLMDNIVQAEAAYIIPGERGQKRMSDVPDSPRILAEITAGEGLKDWDEKLLDWMTKQVRRDAKVSRREARSMAREVNAKWRTLSSFHL